MQAVLLFRYVRWHFVEAPLEILRGWGNLVWFVFNYFSVSLLLRTLFSPWKRIAWAYGRGFNFSNFFYVWTSNLTSRALGAVMRMFLILIGLSAGLLTMAAGIPLVLFWLALPFLVIAGFIYGVFLLF